MPRGIIIKGIGGFYYVEHENLIYECKIRGKFRKLNLRPMVGDNVEFEIISKERGIINEILPRKNSIIRPAVANIDQVVIVFSTVQPQPNFVLIDKLIAMLESKSIGVVLCINKIDLDQHKEFKKLAEIYKNIGYKVVNTSAKLNVGIMELTEVIKNKISAFAGNSGVGKSTLLNSILKNKNMETGELSKKIERGKHTTRHVELFELHQGGFLFDTPGFSILQLSDFESEELKYYYKDFKQFNDNCRFRGCNHINEPDCAVQNAVEVGEIDIDRYERYKVIFEQIKSNKQY